MSSIFDRAIEVMKNPRIAGSLMVIPVELPNGWERNIVYIGLDKDMEKCGWHKNLERGYENPRLTDRTLGCMPDRLKYSKIIEYDAVNEIEQLTEIQKRFHSEMLKQGRTAGTRNTYV